MNKRFTWVCAAVGIVLIFGTFYSVPQARASGPDLNVKVVEGESLGYDPMHTSIVHDPAASGMEALSYQLPSFKDGHTLSGEIELSSEAQEVIVVARVENGTSELEFKIDGSQRFAARVGSEKYLEYREKISIAAGAHDFAIRVENLDSGARLVLDRVEFQTSPASARDETDSLCTLYAAKSGSDFNTGTEPAPFGSVQALLDSLNPGQTGCLKEGIYTDRDDNIEVSSGGASEEERVTLRSAPGERAIVNAQLHIPEGSNYVTVKDLVLDGSRAPKCSRDETCDVLPSVVVNGDYVHFLNNEVTNHNKGICFNIGSLGIVSYSTVIRHNKIYNCGRIPRTNYDHGIYLDHSRGAVVEDNWIYDNADRGIQLRTDTDNTLIQRNVIDGNGVGIIFSGDDWTTSDNNTIRNNIITFSTDRYDVESWYPEGSPEGVGNVVYGNCIYGGDKGEIKNLNGGFKASSNLIQDPLYVNRADDNYSVQNSSCPDVWDGTLDDVLERR